MDPSECLNCISKYRFLGLRFMESLLDPKLQFQISSFGVKILWISIDKKIWWLEPTSLVFFTGIKIKKNIRALKCPQT